MEANLDSKLALFQEKLRAALDGYNVRISYESLEKIGNFDVVSIYLSSKFLSNIATDADTVIKIDTDKIDELMSSSRSFSFFLKELCKDKLTSFKEEDYDEFGNFDPFTREDWDRWGDPFLDGHRMKRQGTELEQQELQIKEVYRNKPLELIEDAYCLVLQEAKNYYSDKDFQFRNVIIIGAHQGQCLRFQKLGEYKALRDLIAECSPDKVKVEKIPSYTFVNEGGGLHRNSWDISVLVTTKARPCQALLSDAAGEKIFKKVLD